MLWMSDATASREAVGTARRIGPAMGVSRRFVKRTTITVLFAE
jgi:hypothetical protein